MKVLSLDGKTHTLNLTSNVPLGDDTRPRSRLHLQVREFLHKTFPTDRILEEVATPEGFFLDFFLPIRRLCVEADGEQHKTFVPFFHKNKINFNKSQVRYRRKAQWCTINSIQFVSLSVDESETEWTKKIFRGNE